tara:strand:+ start:590 stop:1342 length:753 start_codon:yes stop_codon:yes gene_type:complete
MNYIYNYNTGAGGTANPGNVKVKNVVLGFYKETGKVVAEFDIRGLDWNTGDSNYVEAKIVHSSAVKKTVVVPVQDAWTHQVIEWEAGANSEDGTSFNLADLGATDIVLRIEDENNSTTDTTQSVDIDLDPIERFLTLTNPPSFGDDSTPNVVFSLGNLQSEQKLSPVVTNITAGTSASTVTITIESGGSHSLGSDVINLNGIKFSESSLTMNSADAGKAYFSKITAYQLTLPTFAEGENSWSLNLNCTAI